MISNYSLWKIFVLVLCFINFAHVAGNYRENLALRHPCNIINRRLEPYITWTEKLASSQYKVQHDACGQIGVGPACCTEDIVNSYATPLGAELQSIIDGQLDNLTSLLTTSKQHIAIWSNEYIIETHRLTISSLETLFGTKEYRSNIDHSVSNLFNTLNNTHSSVEDVSKSTIDLFNHLIISIYRRFIINDDSIQLDDAFQKCLVNKAFNVEALPKQRELLYILTSASSLIQIFLAMLVYIQADIQRLQTTATIDSDQCIQRYARETLCPICVSSTPSSSSSSNQISNDISEALCENDCRYIIRTCLNETNDPYLVFASMAKNYSDILEEMEQAVIELKLVERLAKLHIYLYDMAVNATNSRQIYMELQTACPNQYVKSFSPIISLSPTITERRELVFQWNKSLHVLLKRTHSSIHNLETKLTKKLMTGICSNPKYVSKSDGCTQIDKQIINLVQWPLPSIAKPILNVNNAELTRNQLDELKKKMIPIQQMTASLQPKKKIALIEYIPDFESYNDDISITDYDTDFSSLIESDDVDIQGSLSERLYSEIDGQTTRRSKVTTTNKSSQQKTSSKAVSIAYSLPIYLTIFIIRQL
ncbi:unnamed protein product [Rotaria magnacalcarata]|uniref:Uncharacterized protein n=1 Tax=Rotaria magnacalcarata TaxID=392030 RepID=A0A816RKA2_9BILA|nr:unnamed protein product [Rotaria magnacalcarata]